MVPVPKTPIDKNRRPIPPHDDVGLAWDALHVEAIAIAMPPKPLPDQQLGLGAFAVDVRHHQVSLFGSEAVGHRVTGFSVQRYNYSGHQHFGYIQ